MKFAIFFIAILATCQAASLMERYPQNLNARSIMQLMVQVEAHIKSGGPYDAILKILENFESSIKDEQVKHAELQSENEKTCAEEITFREVAIREANLAVKEATQLLDSCKAQRARAESDLKISDKQLTNARTTLGSLERSRIQEAELYGKNSEAYKSLLNGIDEAIQILEELKSGSGSFIQISKHTNILMLQAAKVGQIGKLSSVMAAMVQLQGAGSTETFVKLNSLFEGFKADTKRKSAAADEAEAKAIAHYTTVKARLASTIAKLTEQIAALEEEIAELSDCIANQQGLLSSASSKLSRNTKLMNSANALCAAGVRSFETQTVARKDELELLMAIKQKVHERYAQIGNDNGTIDRASLSGDELSNSYVNKSASDGAKFEGY